MGINLIRDTIRHLKFVLLSLGLFEFYCKRVLALIRSKCCAGNVALDPITQSRLAGAARYLWKQRRGEVQGAFAFENSRNFRCSSFGGRPAPGNRGKRLAGLSGTEDWSPRHRKKHSAYSDDAKIMFDVGGWREAGNASFCCGHGAGRRHRVLSGHYGQVANPGCAEVGRHTDKRWPTPSSQCMFDCRISRARSLPRSLRIHVPQRSIATPRARTASSSPCEPSPSIPGPSEISYTISSGATSKAGIHALACETRGRCEHSTHQGELLSVPGGSDWPRAGLFFKNPCSQRSSTRN